MVNKVTLIGNLGADPEMRESNNGMAIATLRVATTSRSKKDGEWVDVTDWHSVVSFGRTAENSGKYWRKGKQIYIEGRLQTRKWEDKDGNTRYKTEVVANEVKFLGGRESRDGDSQDSNRRSRTNGRQNEQRAYDDDDKIPF